MSNIKLFENQKVRTVWNKVENQWHFVVADGVQILTESKNVTDYIKKMRSRDSEFAWMRKFLEIAW
jgi:hypothetical protein